MSSSQRQELPPINSVLQDWVMRLPLRAQGSLLTGIRGGDLTPKLILKPDTVDLPERGLVAYLRWCVLNPADDRETDYPGAFFQSNPPLEGNWKPTMFGHYPLHWYSHLMHCFEIVGYLHPHNGIREKALHIYYRFVEALHLYPEDKEQLLERLTEDRVKAGTIVS